MKPVKVLSYGFCVWLPWLFDQGSFLFISTWITMGFRSRSLFLESEYVDFGQIISPFLRLLFRATAGFIVSHWEDLEIRGTDPDFNTFRLIRALWSELTTGETTDYVF